MAPTKKKPSPEGIEVRRGKRQWRIGAELGSGACGTVHALEEIDGSSTEWAVKVTPIPPATSKKKASQEKINDRLLHIEYVMYMNQFQDIQGTYIPRLAMHSKAPPGQGEADGTHSNLFFMRKPAHPQL